MNSDIVNDILTNCGKNCAINPECADCLTQILLDLAGQITPATPANSNATVTPSFLSSSMSLVMAGLNTTITPIGSGVILITINGIVFNNVGGDGVSIQMAYGTGTPPSGRASPTGTLVGSMLQFTSFSNPQNFSTTWIITGLTIGTAYWVDLQARAVIGGNLSLIQISTVINEIK